MLSTDCALLWSPYVIGQTIIFCPVISIFYHFSFFECILCCVHLCIFSVIFSVIILHILCLLLWAASMMGDCLHWQPATAVIIVQLFWFIYLVNKLSLFPSKWHASWSIQTFCHNRYWPKIGGVPLWRGWAGPHLTQCGQSQGLLACQVSSWSI